MKLHVLVISLILGPLYCLAQGDLGELKGSVIYRTDNDRKVADAGAQVVIYLIDSVKSPDKYQAHHADDSMINNSFLATIYYEEFAHTPIGKTQKRMIRKLKDIDAYPEEKLHQLDNTAAEKNKRPGESRQYARIVADANGNWSVKLPRGYYGIMVRSHHLRSHSLAEGNGNIRLDDVMIKAGATIIKNEEIL